MGWGLVAEGEREREGVIIQVGVPVKNAEVFNLTSVVKFPNARKVYTYNKHYKIGKKLAIQSRRHKS